MTAAAIINCVLTVGLAQWLKSHLILKQPTGGYYSIPIFRMRKSRLREGNWLTYGLTAGRRQRWEPNSCQTDVRALLLGVLPYCLGSVA